MPQPRKDFGEESSHFIAKMKGNAMRGQRILLAGLAAAAALFGVAALAQPNDDSRGRGEAGWCNRTIFRFEHDGSITTIASNYQGKKFNSPNDIVVRSDGSTYWTDSAGGLVIPGMVAQDVQRYLDITRRRGEILNLASDKGRCQVHAYVPLAEVFGYTSDLRNFTSGTASFTMEPSHYSPVKEELADLRVAG